ncbi:aminopeptidase P N-terminal domain-containing protein [bacterium]|nr:aminopeptidase P N-terminal domain-containing protein [bacterium]
MFSTKTYIRRRMALQQRIDSGIVLLMGNEESSMNYEANVYRFRQDSTFLYYFGLNRAGLVGIIDLDNGEQYLFGNDFTIDDFVITSEGYRLIGKPKPKTIEDVENCKTQGV